MDRAKRNTTEVNMNGSPPASFLLGGTLAGGPRGADCLYSQVRRFQNTGVVSEIQGGKAVAERVTVGIHPTTRRNI
jgi:hypothetical protein